MSLVKIVLSNEYNKIIPKLVITPVLIQKHPPHQSKYKPIIYFKILIKAIK